MAWPLLPGTDLVLQMHLQPTGKVEKVKPAIGLYFAKTPPSRSPFVLGLRSLLIDIPAGEKNYSFEIRYQLPVDVEVLAVLPHAHYLGKEMKGQAALPDGTTKWLLDIEEWDFSWQGEYRFAKPVFLPKGSVITQRFSYDNSSQNPRNPQVPPGQVRYGPRSIDEMGELWIQVLPRRPEDRPALENDYRLWKGENENLRKAMSVLERTPNDWKMLLEVAKIRAMQGRMPEALHYTEWAIRSAPEEAEPHHVLGSFKMQEGTRQGLGVALEHLEAAIRLRADYFEAYNDLGYVLRNLGQRGRAAQCYERARQLAPDDPTAVYNLGTLAYEQGQRAMALELIRRALAIDPSYEPAGEALRRIQKPE
jgi:Flp pilus assembly protein TadD